jgi:hypothetical protein
VHTQQAAAAAPPPPEGFTVDELKAMNVKGLKEAITKMGLKLPEHAFDKNDFLEVLRVVLQCHHSDSGVTVTVVL